MWSESLKMSVKVYFNITTSPGVHILWWDNLLGQGQLVQIESQEVSSAEDGHHYTQRAEDEQADGATEHPPPYQTEKRRKVYS